MLTSKIFVMQKASSISKIFSFCIFSFYLLISCETASAQKDYSNNGCGGVIHKPTRNIRIQNDETSPDKIKLIDEVGCPAYTLHVLPGQNVDWQIDGSIIKSIDKIVLKSKADGTTVFEQPPGKKSSKHWKGKIKKSDSSEAQEYDISWIDAGDSSRTYDPLIQLNPNFDSATKSNILKKNSFQRSSTSKKKRLNKYF